MPIVDAEPTVEQVREGLRRIEPPYLLRKYDATVEDFDEIVDEDLRCEFLDGVLIVHSPASFQHEERISFLTIVLGHFVAARGLGRVSGSNTVMKLGDRRLCPDLSFLKTEHIDRIQGGQIVGPMDLAIEMLSKSTRNYDLDEKRAAYQRGGVPEIWLIDSEQRTAHFDSAEAQGYSTQTLTGGRFASRVLSGLSIDVSWFWSDPLPNPLDCLASMG